MTDRPDETAPDAWPGAFDLPRTDDQAARKKSRQEELRRARQEYAEQENAGKPQEVELTSKRWGVCRRSHHAPP